MKASRQQPVLAVGMDSAEPKLVRALIDRGELPTLASLLGRGSWALVDSRADIGSGAVWPTFFTGTDPSEHHMYSGWLWRPDQMACTVPGDGFFRPPFWKSLADHGQAVGVVDVPWAPFGGMTRGFQLSEWGPHEGGHRGPRVGPHRVQELVSRSGRHPFQELPYGPGQADDLEGKGRLASAALAGARLRGELAAKLITETRPALSIVVFSEVHHAGHHLWQQVEPDHPLYIRHSEPLDDVKPSLVDIYREVDRQLGRIVEAAGPETATVAFSLHGMKPGPGIPTVVDPLLEALGFATSGGWGELSWRGRAAAAFGAAKRRAPASLRRTYYSRASFAARQRIARSTIVRPRDWWHTRAFSLPSDQRAYVRVNLAGREAKGIVPLRDYEAVCDELSEALRTAESADGEPLVRSVLRSARDGASPPKHLPDLIVDWGDAAFARPVRARAAGVEFEADPIRQDMTGQHARRGFCILDERLEEGSLTEPIAGKDLHRLLLSAANAEPAPTRS